MVERRPLSILLLNPTGIGVWGGVEAWMRSVAIGLRARGHRIRAAGRAGGRFLSGLAEQDIDGHEVGGRNDFSPRDIHRLRKMQRRHRVDVVITKLNRGIRLAGMSARLAGGRRAVMAHMGLMEAKPGLGSRLAYRAFLTGVNVPCRSIEQELVEDRGFRPDGVRVIPYGVDLGRFEPDVARRDAFRAELGIDNRPLIALVARLDDQKGHANLLEALTGLEAVHALIVGSGALEAELRQRVADLDLGGRVHFLGHCRDVRGPLDAADALVLPSYDEGLPYVVLESMAMGLPVVATRVGGLPEVVIEGETGFLVDPGDIDQLAAAIERMVALPDRGRSLGRTGREMVLRDYGESMMVQAVEQFLYELVTRRGRIIGAS